VITKTSKKAATPRLNYGKQKTRELACLRFKNFRKISTSLISVGSIFWRKAGSGRKGFWGIWKMRAVAVMLEITICEYLKLAGMAKKSVL